MKDVKLINNVSSAVGTADYNDITFDVNGDVVTIDGEDRVLQDLSKLMLTPDGTYAAPNYGTGLDTLTSKYPAELIPQQAAAEITQAVQFYVFKNEGETIPDDEKVAAMTDLKASSSNGEAVAEVKLLTKAGTDIVFGVGT